MIPEKYHTLMLINPMTGIVMSYHDVLVYNKMPDVSLLIYPAIIAIVGLVLALVMYKGANEEMADVL